MSTTIDQRIVEMQFDNRQFESNVHTSMSTLDKLKNSLKLDGASKGLENINNLAKNNNVSMIGAAAETVGLKFNALQTYADQTMRRITDSVNRTAKNMISAFTIDPIKTGLQEYETQINSVQTIMANTSHQGTTLNDVNSALDTLNAYADKTIYNFTEMTRNIGTFTAAGVDLQTSVDSIQGIANLAAVSGSTSQQASTAMYQLSQALAAGKVSLMDWNSVVNAGMGGKVFQDALVRTSELLDTGAKKAIEAHGSFRESLTKGEWLTTEVLTETLKQMAGAYSEADLVAQGFTQSQAKEIAAMAKTASDAATKVKTFTQLMDTLKESVQSGWTQTWELLIGDFEEAKELWTSVSDTLGGFINDMSESRNTLLAETLNSPWEKLIEQINKAGVETSAFEEKVRAIAKDNGVDMDALVEKYGSFEDACRSGKVSSDILSDALKGLGKSSADLSKITGELKLGDVGDDVKEAQKVLQAMGHDLGKAGIDGIIGSATENAIKEFQKAKGIEVTGIIDEKTLEALKEANTSVTDLSESCGGLVGKITELGGREMLIQSFANIFKALSNILRQVKYAFREVFPKASAENLISLIERFKNFTEAMKPSINTMWKVRDTFKGVFSVISIGVEIFKAVGSGFMTLLGKVLGFRGGLLSVTASIGNWLTSLNESIKKTDIFGKAVDKIVGFISNSIDKIAEFGKTVKESLKAPKSESFTNLFTSIWNIVRNLGASIIEAVGSISTTIANAFGKGDIFEVFNSLFVSGSFLSIKKFVDSLNEELDIDGGIFENISGILEEARGCLQAYQETLKAEALKKIATAIALLAASLFVISTIDPNQLSKALGAITVLFVELLAGMALFNKMGGTFKGVLKAIPLMIAMSTAILMLSAAMKNLANISWEGIAKGLIGIGVLMAELFVFMKYAKINVGMTASAVSIVILASALVILGDAVEKFANISWSGLVKGLAAIGVFLAEFTIFSKYVSKDMGVMAAGAALVLLATSMKILAAAMGEFAVISWEGIAKGLVGMAAAMTAMTVALNFIPRDSALRAAGLIVAAYAIEILYDILSQLGELSWAEMAKSLTTLGVALQLIGFGLKAMKGSIDGSAALLIASAALRVFAPVMQTLGSLEWGQIAKGLVAIAGAFAVFGLAGLLLAPITPALMALSTAFAMLGVAMLGIGAGLALAGVGITSLSVALAAGATAIVAGLTTIIVGLLNLVPEIAQIIGRTILETAAILGDYAPQLADSLCKLVVSVVNSLREYAPQLVDSLLVLFIDVINGLSAHIPTLIEAFANLFANIFKGITSAMKDADTGSLLKGIAAIGLMAVIARLLKGTMSILPAAMAGLFAVGVLIAELTLILAAIGGMAQIPGLKWLVTEGGALLEEVGRALGRAIGGIIGGVGEAVSNSLPKIGENIAEMMEFLGDAGQSASSIKPGSFDGVTELIEALGAISLATVGSSISDIFTLGGTSMERFQKDGVAFFNAMSAISESANGIKLDKESIGAIIDFAVGLVDLQKSLEPIGGVMDWFTGRDDLAAFGKNAGTFILSLKTAFGSLDNYNLNSEALKAIVETAIELTEMKSSLDGIGGVMDWFVGKKDLAAFGINAATFIRAMKNAFAELNGCDFNSKALAQIIIGAQALSRLQSTLDSVGGVIDWFTGRDDLGTFGINAGLFIVAMKTAYSELDGCDFNATALQQIIEGATVLSTLQSSLNSIGGVIDWFTGRDDLGTFGVNAAAFILAMKVAYGTLDGCEFNAIALQQIVDGAYILSTLQSSLDSVGGIVDWFTGRDDLGTFGVNAAAFILAMKVAYGSLDGCSFNVDAMTQIVEAATSLSTLQSSLDSVGGIIDWFTGRDDLSTFGANAASFVLGMKLAYSNLDGCSFNAEAMTQIVTAAIELSKLQSSLESVGGIIDWFTGRDDLSTFGINAGTFIRSMSMALGGLKNCEFNSEALSAIISATKELSSLQSSLDSIGGIISWFTGHDDLATFGINIFAFINAMKMALGGLKDFEFNNEALSSIISATTELSTLQSSLDSIGGIVEWFTGRNDLASFGINIWSFINSMKLAFGALDGAEFNVEAMSAIVSAATELSTLQSSLENVGGVIGFFTGEKDLTSFGTNVAGFIGSIKTAFADIGADFTINTEAMSSIVSAATELSTLQSTLDTMGGVLAFFNGEQMGLDTFGSNVAAFIGSMVTACGSLDGVEINTTSLSSIITAATELATLQSSLESVGGVISWFTGEQMDLETFGTQIGHFASAMGSLRDNMGENGISETVVTSITNTGNALLALNETLPEKGWFDKKEDLTTFSEHITSFAEAIASFSATASTLNADGIDIAMNTANRIKELINNISTLDTSGVAKFTGIGTGGVGADGPIADIATAMSTFSSKVSGIDTAAVSTASTSALKLKSLINGLVDLDTSGVSKFKPESIGTAMKSYMDKVAGMDTSAVSGSVTAANRLKSLINGLAGIDTSGVDSFISAVKKLCNMNISDFKVPDLSGLGSDLVTSIVSGISSKASSMTTTMSTNVSNMLKSINDKKDNFKTAGMTLMSSLVTGLKTNADKVKPAATSSIASAVTAVRSNYSSFKTAGKWLGDGLVEGINAKKQAAYDAGYALGQKAQQGVKDGEGAASPSKEGIKAGKWLGEGLIIGIADMGAKVYKAGHNMGDTAAKSLSAALSRANELVSSNMDSQPTIRPVLDLSSIKSSAGSIRSLLGDASVGVNANVGAISSMMSRRSQKESNADVVSAIMKLNDKLNNIGNTGNTYQVGGVTYDDGSNVASAVKSLIRAARIDRRA